MLDYYEIDKIITESSLVTLCPVCIKQDLTSKSFIKYATVKHPTTMVDNSHHYDELKYRHYHGTNQVLINFNCSNGHDFIKQQLNSCWCGWQQEI